MNESLMVNDYVRYCDSLLALRKSGDWKSWHDTWEDYVSSRWGLSKTRAKLLCNFAKFRQLLEAELFGTLPETPEQVKAILALPQKQWVETWELVVSFCSLPLRPGNIEAALQHFHIYANKRPSPEALKAIRVRRAAKTLADMQSGEQLVQEIGAKALGKNWSKAVEVVIDADQTRLTNERAKIA